MMRAEPQAAPYQPDPQIEAISGWIGGVVQPAEFPQQILCYRNRPWDAAVGLDDLTDEQWTAHLRNWLIIASRIIQVLRCREMRQAAATG